MDFAKTVHAMQPFVTLIILESSCEFDSTRNCKIASLSICESRRFAAPEKSGVLGQKDKAGETPVPRRPIWRYLEGLQSNYCSAHGLLLGMEMIHFGTTLGADPIPRR